MNLSSFWRYAPHRLLTEAVGILAKTRIVWVKNFLINGFIKLFKVNIAEAESQNIDDYPNFNAFFARRLKQDARPICNDSNAFISPADGVISNFGNINQQEMIQAKGHKYTVGELFAESITTDTETTSIIDSLNNGSYYTVYLSPKDYHRVHIPMDGYLESMTYVPGRLYPVKTATTEAIDKLFAKNERVILRFKTSSGPMVLVMVGALIVGSISLTWCGYVTPPRKNMPFTVTYPNESLRKVFFKSGEEIGFFAMGSTVIGCVPPEVLDWKKDLKLNQNVRMGELLGKIRDSD